MNDHCPECGGILVRDVMEVPCCGPPYTCVDFVDIVRCESCGEHCGVEDVEDWRADVASGRT